MLSILGKDVHCVFEVKECPHLGVALQDDMATTSAVAPIGSCFGVVLHSEQMRRACASFARAYEDFDVVYEVTCHAC